MPPFRVFMLEPRAGRGRTALAEFNTSGVAPDANAITAAAVGSTASAHRQRIRPRCKNRFALTARNTALVARRYGGWRPGGVDGTRLHRPWARARLYGRRRHRSAPAARPRNSPSETALHKVRRTARYRQPHASRGDTRRGASHLTSDPAHPVLRTKWHTAGAGVHHFRSTVATRTSQTVEGYVGRIIDPRPRRCEPQGSALVCRSMESRRPR